MLRDMFCLIFNGYVRTLVEIVVSAADTFLVEMWEIDRGFYLKIFQAVNAAFLFNDFDELK